MGCPRDIGMLAWMIIWKSSSTAKCVLATQSWAISAALRYTPLNLSVSPDFEGGPRTSKLLTSRIPHILCMRSASSVGASRPWSRSTWTHQLTVQLSALIIHLIDYLNWADTFTRSWAGQEISFILWSPNVLYCVRKSPPLVPLHLVHILSIALQPFVGPWPLFQFLDLSAESVGLLGRGISPSQGRNLHTGQHTNRE
jgi:hypothetical protein